jgi:TDG/mug DNA glycosylase family protein
VNGARVLEVTRPHRPTKQELAQARGKSVPNVIKPGLTVLFCGINPGLYSAAVGHHFARPGNRFWKAIHRAGFTERLLSPFEERELLRAGCGITNIVKRATATATELTREELIQGGRQLGRKVRRYRPLCVVFLGVTAYRIAFGLEDARLGRQKEQIAGRPVWVLPNPSGLNAHVQLPELARQMRAVRRWLGSGRSRV